MRRASGRERERASERGRERQRLRDCTREGGREIEREIERSGERLNERLRGTRQTQTSTKKPKVGHRGKKKDQYIVTLQVLVSVIIIKTFKGLLSDQ